MLVFKIETSHEYNVLTRNMRLYTITYLKINIVISRNKKHHKNILFLRASSYWYTSKYLHLTICSMLVNLIQ
ncbi:unnamed protein product [Tenebrio molitor]|nr:unnamed protein product [Tenebrio molitor]